MDFTKETDRQSTIGSTNSSSMSMDSMQAELEVLPEMADKLKILTDGMDESILENASLENQMSAFLKEIRLDFQSLPTDIREGLEKVCDILEVEGLSDMNIPSLEVHLLQKHLKAKKEARAEAEFKINYEEAFKKYKRMEEKLFLLQSNVESLASKIVTINENYNSEESERILMLTKLNAYEEKVVAYEKQLQDLQVDELHPDIIMKTSNTLLEKLAELDELNKYLSKYGDLPPNLLQAKAALESKKKELEKLERMFTERFT